MKKIVGIFILSVALISSFIVYADTSERENFATYGEFLQDLNLIKGDDNGNLNPNDSLSREEAVVIILRMLREEEQAKKCQAKVFSDLHGRWSEPYVNYAKQKGLVNGISEHSFGATDKVTIKQLYTMFLRAAGYSADWATEDIVAKAEQYGLAYDLDQAIDGDKAALRGHSFIIFSNAITLPTNPEVENNSCVLTKVLREHPNTYQLALKYEDLIDYLPDSYQADYGFMTGHANHENNKHANEHDKHDVMPVNSVKFELLKSSVTNENGIVLEFSQDLAMNTGKDEIEVYSSYGKNDIHYESFYTNPDNYKVIVDNNKVWIKFYEDNGKQVSNLSGLNFVVKYTVDNKVDNASDVGKVTVSYDGDYVTSGGGLELVKAEPSPDARNVINLWFNQLLDYHEISNDSIDIISVSGDYGEFSEEWFKDDNNYVVGTTDKKVYIRYMDGSSSIELEDLVFEIEYDIKARENDDRAEGEVTVDFDRK